MLRPVTPFLLPVYSVAPLPLKGRLPHPHPVPVDAVVPPARLRLVHPVANVPSRHGRPFAPVVARVIVRLVALHLVMGGPAKRAVPFKRVDVYAGRAVVRRRVRLPTPLLDGRRVASYVVVLVRPFRVVVMRDVHLALGKRVVLFAVLPLLLAPPYPLPMRPPVAVHVVPYLQRVVPVTRLLRRQLHRAVQAAPFPKRDVKPVGRVVVPPFVVRGLLVERRRVRLKNYPPKLRLQVVPLFVPPSLVGPAGVFESQHTKVPSHSISPADFADFCP